MAQKPHLGNFWTNWDTSNTVLTHFACKLTPSITLENVCGIIWDLPPKFQPYPMLVCQVMAQIPNFMPFLAVFGCFNQICMGPYPKYNFRK